MSVSNTSSASSSSVTTSSVDVAAIVEQLMTVENRPMDALKAKISSVQTQISDLGTIKSKVATLQSAVSTFEDPSTYSNPIAATSDSSVVTAVANSKAVIGSVDISVSQLATASKLILTGPSGNYSSPNATVSIDSTNGFAILVGSHTYNTKDSANPLISTGALGATTLTDLKNWINGLGADVQANIVQTVSSSDYVLQISGTQTGSANAVNINLGNLDSLTGSALSSLSGATIGSYPPAGSSLTTTTNGSGSGATIQVNIASSSAGTVTVAGGSGYKIGDTITIAAGQLGAGSSAATFTITEITGSSHLASVSAAQDAIATIGGVTVNRSSNAISDVVNGITFNLVGKSVDASSSIITVQQGADNSSAMINTLIKAYNDVVAQYNIYTANSNSGTGSTNGTFANDPTMLSFVNNIKAMFAYGATDTTTADIVGYNSASVSAGLDVPNGYLKINGVKYNFSSIGQSDPSVSQFIAWINGLNSGVTASFDGENISIRNSQTNGTNSIDLSGVSNSVERTTVSLAAMGMDIQLDGTIQFNTSAYQQAASSGLFGKMSKGLKMGFSGNGSSLAAFLISEIDPSKGALVGQIAAQKSSILDLQKRQTTLQEHLNQVQNNYITQYSALNALLFELNSTSTSLASALTAITNINASK